MDKDRPPWWILLLGAACLLFLFFACYVQVTGPEPVGWLLERPLAAGSEPVLVIAEVRAGSPAARAGLRLGDRLRERDLRKLAYQEEVGRQYRFEVEGRGVVSIVLNRPTLAYWLSGAAAGVIISTLIAALDLLLAVMIVLARPRDTAARWGALVMASLSAFAPWYGLARPAGLIAGVRDLPVAAAAILLLAPAFSTMGPGIIVTFLAGFPRSALSSRQLAILFWVSAPIGFPVVLYGVWMPVYAPERALSEPPWLGSVFMMAAAVFCVAGAGLLARNYVRLKDANERRRVRVVVLGFLISMLGIASMFALTVARRPAWQFNPFPTSAPLAWAFAPLSAAAPLSMAYGILRHRMFDIRVMIRQGLQYAAARGLLLSPVPLLGILLALDLLRHGDRPLAAVLAQRGWIYLALAAAAFLLHARQKTWLAALDRRFFRERYQAQCVLSEVVEEVRASREFTKAALRVVGRIDAALHPETAAVLVRQPGEADYRALACAGSALPPIPANSKIMGLVKLLAKPLEIPQSESGWVRQQLPHEESELLKQARLEWLFPISLEAGGAEAILTLGPKRSEEPYSREDQNLLKAVTGSLALLLERAPVSTASGTGFGECPRCGTCYDSGADQCANEGAPLARQTFPRLLARRYRFERRLGCGGMGTVYEARDTELERQVAVKLIRPELMSSPEASARFKREARAAAGFSHPNVVTVFDFGVAEDRRAYLVMELLRGRTLRQEMRDGRRLAPGRAAEILRGACAAVAAAHERRLLHRDLKPENIFLAQAAGVEIAKVVDFGVAKLIGAGEDTVTLGDTAPGVLVGTPLYMSPEQLRGGPPAESWDLWALAVIAYEMLTGAYPFAVAASAWQQAALAGAVIPARAHFPEAPETWDIFFGRVLAPDPGLRPSSAAQLAAEFGEMG